MKLYTLDKKDIIKTIKVYKFIPTGFDYMSSSGNTHILLIWNIRVRLNRAMSMSIGGCALQNPSYIGQTRNNVKTRLNQHRQNGAIPEHIQQSHNINTVQLDTLLSKVKMLKIIPDYHKLTIYKALAILHRKPDLNRQIDNFVNPLKLFSRSTHISNITTDPLQNTIINYNYTNLARSATPQASSSPTPHRCPTPRPPTVQAWVYYAVRLIN